MNRKFAIARIFLFMQNVEKRDIAGRFLKFLGVALTLVCGASRALAVDGIAIINHHDHSGPGGIHDSSVPGDMVRIDVKDDKVVSSKVIYDKHDFVIGTISPVGDRIAFTRSDGGIAVIPIDGGTAVDIGSFTGGEDQGANFSSTYLQWPSSEGGQWIYYLDNRNKGSNNDLRRINVNTRDDQKVVHFNRWAGGSFGLSMDATPHSGLFIKRTDNYVIAIYDMAVGDGDMYACNRTFGCGESISPDGTQITANAGDHASVNIVDPTGKQLANYRLGQWDGDPDKGLPREQMRWAWQAFHWSINDANWVTVTQGYLKPGSTSETIYEDAMLYDFNDAKQINLTRNSAAHFDRAQAFWVTNATQISLGYFQGKAPLTITMNDKRLPANAAIDFGDGQPARGGQHVYNKAGNYKIVVKDGGLTYMGYANVQPQTKPQATAFFVDPQTLLVEFSEPVQNSSKSESDYKLDSGIKIATARLNDSGKEMTIRLASPLTGNDMLHLVGLQDFAQQPNALDTKGIAVKIPEWPSNRQGLIYIWENNKVNNAIYDAATGGVRELRVSRANGTADFDRYGRMHFDRGSMSTGFFSQSNTGQDFKDLIQADAYTLECTFQTSDLHQNSVPPDHFAARIVNCSAWHGGDWEFMLAQKDDKLLFSIRTTKNWIDLNGKPTKAELHGRAPIYTLATLTDMNPHHIVVTYKPGTLVAYMDGGKIFETKEVDGDLTAFGYGELVFGGHHNGGQANWKGRLEGVAIFGRYMEADEAARNYALYSAKIKARPTVPQAQLEATLLATTPIPQLKDVAPYRDALIMSEFQITKVDKTEKGFPAALKDGEKIRVAQWGLVDGLPSNLGEIKPGQTEQLTLETFEHNPDKADQMEKRSALPEDYDAPLLYEPRQ